jgi:hypothetical protein
MNYDEAVEQLVQSHSDGDRYLRLIMALPDGQDGVVRLLEVTEAVPNTDEVRLDTLLSSRDFPYHLGIVQVTPEEWGKISAQPPALPLPAGWRLPDLRQVWPR